VVTMATVAITKTCALYQEVFSAAGVNTDTRANITRVNMFLSSPNIGKPDSVLQTITEKTATR
jgi:hypothetical protein